MLKISTQSLKSKSKSYLNNTTKVLTSSTDYAHSGVIVLLEPLNCDHIKKWSSTTVREPVVFTSWAVGINGLKVCQGNIPLNITPPWSQVVVSDWASADLVLQTTFCTLVCGTSRLEQILCSAKKGLSKWNLSCLASDLSLDVFPS